MPAQSTITSDDKSKIKSSLPQPQYKILTATFARVYHAYPDPNTWSYAEMQGALVFVRDNSIAGFLLKMVDLFGTRGVIWEHELHEPLSYYLDLPLFHSFAGDKFMIGLAFVDEMEASVLYRKITNRQKYATARPKSKGIGSNRTKRAPPPQGSFIHVAHMGYDAERGFTSTGVDASWLALFTQLRDMGVDESILQDKDNQRFMRDFVRTYQSKNTATSRNLQKDTNTKTKSEEIDSEKSKTKVNKSQQASSVRAAPMGDNAENGFTSNGVDTQLHDMGVDESGLQEKDDERFMRDFVQNYHSETVDASSMTNMLGLMLRTDLFTRITDQTGDEFDD